MLERANIRTDLETDYRALAPLSWRKSRSGSARLPDALSKIA
jgi:hypothetical protein